MTLNTLPQCSPHIPCFTDQLYNDLIAVLTDSRFATSPNAPAEGPEYGERYKVLDRSFLFELSEHYDRDCRQLLRLLISPELAPGIDLHIVEKSLMKSKRYTESLYIEAVGALKNPDADLPQRLQLLYTLLSGYNTMVWICGYLIDHKE